MLRTHVWIPPQISFPRSSVEDALRHQEDAERPERHADAEHRHDSHGVTPDDYRSSRSGVTPEGWMQPLEASWVNIQSRQNSQP
ncbi:hypothetical protein GIV71_25330 [Pseudomonas syringae]|nr:hypothetical protein [Pseudomonas syringae]MCF5424287.1 hypothetical protein [Pseudomonas syringae]MCF5481031.1 hypothetical protein [Pseudomonas syringae]MCF5553747.1 hypothetical protein [Pseudomonas syringae]